MKKEKINNVEKIIFDLDVGVDDAMALIMSFYDPSYDVKLITTVYGNVGIKQATKNTCYLVQEYGDKDYPIYMGNEQPLDNPIYNAQEVHGRNGLGTKVVAKNVKKKVSNKPGYGAIEAMRDTILAYPNEITIVSVGPTTNVAKLLTTYPEVKDKIKRIVIMVGSMDGKGSITPYSSFNSYCDPDAVKVVITSGVPITLTTKEIGTTAYFEQKQRERFAKCGSCGPLFYDLCEGYRDMILKHDQYAVHDTCALFSILDTDLFTREKVDMEVNTTRDIKRGQTKFKPNPNSHITLITTVDKKKLFKRMEKILKNS